ncbi:uncharacterized protein LOC103720978 isoform X2 [Phoenix dactylifera]|uniref:Uncharacterized protein LOC103720978 isoform X2 n=1 Tax=Phoenix dactylifera TaxID=42345 RepID=A0A8B7CY99_PHODC|nr:uncharacterized protein LOC103720978 isoform X2 [Phoenix dactylifera]
MARKKGGDEPARESSMPAPSLSDALLFTTLCIVGLPVDVLVKDGSVYSGVFHTACLQDGYGVVLKKARRIGKGKCDASLPTGAVIDTLILLSADLAEIVVKDFLLPAEGIVGSAIDDGVEVAARDIVSQACAGELEGGADIIRSDSVTSIGKMDQIEGKEFLSSSKTEDAKEVTEVLAKPLERDGSQENICLVKVEEPYLMPIVSIHDRQVMACRGQGKGDCNHIDEMVHEGHCLSPSYGVGCDSLATVPAWKGVIESESPARTISPSSYANSSAISTSSTSVLYNKASSYLSQSESTILSAPKKSTLGTISAKESKLNPSAEVFSPSFANSRSASTTGTPVICPVYMPTSLPAMPIAGVQSGIGISPSASHSSRPSKFVPYNSLVAGHTGIGAQYPRPVMGHASARQQPARFGAQNHPVQTGPPYVNPNPQTVMVGQMGQLVYVNPITQDPIQGPQVISQGFSHSLLTPYQANMPKLQGTAAPPLQLCMAPPLIAGSNQPLMVPSNIPTTQPFPAIRPIMVPSGNGIFTSRFQ